jgi:hypothetical protein
MCNTKCDINDPEQKAPPIRVFKNAWFARFASKNKISDGLLLQAIQRAEDGLIDADLGSGVIKQRISRTGAGKSRGFRSIIFFKESDLAFFIYGFAKNEIENLKPSELVQYRNAAKTLLSLAEPELNALIANGTFERIKPNEPEISHQRTGCHS